MTGELANMGEVYRTAQRIDNPSTFAYFHHDNSRVPNCT
jgi:hypothetical protein